jgi:RNase P/RNase MRP subunit POP5
VCKEKALVLVYVLYYTFYSTKMKGTKDTKKSSNNGDTKLKQKVLLPTLKEQQRYIVYKVLFKNSSSGSNDTLNPRDFGALHNAILSQCNSLLGVFDGGKAGLMSVKYNAEKMTGIIRVNNKYVDKMKVCLGLIKELNGHCATIDCIYVSGMLNKAAEKMNA